MAYSNKTWLSPLFLSGMLFPFLLFSQAGSQFLSQSGSEIDSRTRKVESTVIREDYSVRIDGSYRGYQSREIYGRSFPEGLESGLPKRRSSWYGTAAFRREANYSAKELSINLEGSYLIHPKFGELALSGEKKPLRLNIPFILQEWEEAAGDAVADGKDMPGGQSGQDGQDLQHQQPGPEALEALEGPGLLEGAPKKWEMRGSDMFLLENRAISVETKVLYTDQGLVTAEGRSARQIAYRYPLRLKAYEVRNLGIEDSIRELFGSVNGILYLYQDDKGGAFMKERILRRIVSPKGSIRDEEGFRLIWQEGVSEGTLEQLVQKIALNGETGIDKQEDILAGEGAGEALTGGGH
jgi:hypothetical protein